MPEVKASTFREELSKLGYLCRPRTAKRAHVCSADGCIEMIPAGKSYQEVVKGGGEMSWMKFPDRVHDDDVCLQTYLEMLQSASLRYRTHL